MIKPSKVVRRRLGYAAVTASALLITAQFASAVAVDPAITAAISAAGTANIEAIAGIGVGPAGNMGSGSIKLSGKNVKALFAGMVNAILLKTTTATGDNRLLNKIDESAEVTVAMLNAMFPNKKFNKLGGTKKTVLTAAKAALSGAKGTAELASSAIFRDIAGSIALTIGNNPKFAANEEKIQKFLLKKAKSIAGSLNVAAAQQGLNTGFDDSVNGNILYEDGGIATLYTVTDPETDQRPA